MKRLLFILLIFCMVSVQAELDQEGINCDEDNNCNVNLDSYQEKAKYEIYHTHEITGNLIHNIINIEYYDILSSKININMFSNQDKNPRIFDFKIYKNEKLIEFEPYVDFYQLNESRRAIPPSYIAESNDRIVLDYYSGDKIIFSKINVFFFNFSLSDFFYPFDKYEYDSWAAPHDALYQRIDKVILPNSFSLIEQSNSCPASYSLGIYKKKINQTTNITYHKLIQKILIGIEEKVMPGGEKVNFISKNGDRIIIWPTLLSGPKEDVKFLTKIDHNLTEEEWNSIRDYRTGCFLSIKYGRTSITKYFFIISTLMILLLTSYLLWFNNDKNKFVKITSGTFIVWSFQEGLSSLTPLIRPTRTTLFDLTLFFPLILILIFYRRKIYNYSLKQIKNFKKKLNKIKK